VREAWDTHEPRDPNGRDTNRGEMKWGSIVELRAGLHEQAGVGGAREGRNSKKRNSPAGSRADPNLAGGSGDGGAEEGNPRRHATGTGEMDGMGWKRAGALPRF
jgi:hypothetical protein